MINLDNIMKKIDENTEIRRQQINDYNTTVEENQKKKFDKKTVLDEVKKVLENDIIIEFNKLENELNIVQDKLNKVKKRTEKLKENELKYIKECIEKYNCSKIRTTQLFNEKFNKKITKYRLNNICKENNIKFKK